MTEADVVTVPPDLVQPLRDGLYRDLGTCLAQTCAAVQRHDRTRIRAVVKERFRRAEPIRDLLDEVGWVEPEEGPPPVEVDLREHRNALLRALRALLKRENAVAEDTEAPEAERSAAAALVGPLTAFVQKVEERETR
jgi:Lon protease-like protein